jgi:hypothetical protein
MKLIELFPTMFGCSDGLLNEDNVLCEIQSDTIALSKWKEYKTYFNFDFHKDKALMSHTICDMFLKKYRKQV